jgi:hypothetical protein
MDNSELPSVLWVAYFVFAARSSWWQAPARAAHEHFVNTVMSSATFKLNSALALKASTAMVSLFTLSRELS